MDEKIITGYKVFNPDWTCRGKQYSCPGTFEEDVVPKMCQAGMHFCPKLIDCFSYYDFTPENHVAEVRALGAIDENGDDKICTNKLDVVRELSWHEALNLINTGRQNTGIGNAGNRNAGNRNTGDWNTGNWNAGHRNTGNWNTGHGNTGDWNAGHRNTGDWNTGDWNTGHWNTGDWNTGSWNTGSWNTGHKNAGDWNTGSWNTGAFNTKNPEMTFFNKKSTWTFEKWLNSKARKILNSMPPKIQWATYEKMTEEEKKAHPESETTGGYLSVKDRTAEVNAWWAALPQEDKDEVLALPNFDKEIFKEITGIYIESGE